MVNTDNWKTIWINKSAEIYEEDILGSLIKANGFDHGNGNCSTEQWITMTAEISKLLNLNSASKILEVGCGSGAFLYGLQIASHAKTYGYDYSPSLIKIASKFVKGEFKVSDALVNPFDQVIFDCVISHSVFQYFPSRSYAFKAIESMAKNLKRG